jgi:hypothetical protein
MGEDSGAASSERAPAYGAIGGEWPTDLSDDEPDEPGTTDHFRLVATNDTGEAESADATLATPDG